MIVFLGSALLVSGIAYALFFFRHDVERDRYSYAVQWQQSGRHQNRLCGWRLQRVGLGADERPDDLQRHKRHGSPV